MVRMLQQSILVLGFLVVAGLAWADQPPGKTAAGAPDKNAPAKQAPGKQTPGKTTTPASNSNAEQLVTYTFDGVRIEGDYYPAPEAKAKNTPCLILVHAVGPKHFTASRADFGKLPEKLQKMGYAVAVVDMRGYGKSKTVENKFWNTHRPKSKVLDQIEGKDYATSLDLLEMVQDLTAVKIWLNTKNNAKECNSHAIGVIGLEQGGLIAMAWAGNELTDPARVKQRGNVANNGGGLNNPNGVGNTGQGNTGFNNTGFGNAGFGNTGFGNNPGQFGNQTGGTVPRYEGEDITCIVSVSTSNRLGDPLSLSLLEKWITFLRERQVSSMAIYGANDKEAAGFWSKAGVWAKPTTDKYRYRNSGTKPIKGTSLVGAKLLTNDTLDVTKMLEEYLADAVKKVSEGRLWSEQTGPDRPTPFDVQRLLR